MWRVKGVLLLGLPTVPKKLMIDWVVYQRCPSQKEKKKRTL
jgi:hypothetical protein